MSRRRTGVRENWLLWLIIALLLLLVYLTVSGQLGPSLHGYT